MRHYVIKELSGRTELHDEEEFALSFNDLNKYENIETGLPHIVELHWDGGPSSVF